MTYHITKNATPINEETYATVADALAFATAPAWAGAKATEITMINDTTYKSSGYIYNIIAGTNPRTLRANAPMKTATAARHAHRQYQAKAGWLSREMDRADSDY